MTKRSRTCRPWDIVVVPFPFVGGDGAKRRPALVISSEAFGPSGHAVLAMITTSTRRTWPGDLELADLGDAGLDRPCILRLKLFTLDQRLILRTIGRLSARDRKRVGGSLRRFLAIGHR
jgi:mRNA interferase MazF